MRRGDYKDVDLDTPHHKLERAGRGIRAVRHLIDKHGASMNERCWRQVNAVGQGLQNILYQMMQGHKPHEQDALLVVTTLAEISLDATHGRHSCFFDELVKAFHTVVSEYS